MECAPLTAVHLWCYPLRHPMWSALWYPHSRAADLTEASRFTNSCGCASVWARAQTVCVLPRAEDLERLLAVVADRNRPLKHVQRARIVLYSADRLPVREVARRASVSRPAVWRWQARYAEQGAGVLRGGQIVEHHFTPTSASWLNAVEGFFSVITRRPIRRGAFHSVDDLQTRSHATSTPTIAIVGRSHGPLPPKRSSKNSLRSLYLLPEFVRQSPAPVPPFEHFCCRILRVTIWVWSEAVARATPWSCAS